LQLIAFYHDGQKVDNRPRQVLAELMGIDPKGQKGRRDPLPAERTSVVGDDLQ